MFTVINSKLGLRRGGMQTVTSASMSEIRRQRQTEFRKKIKETRTNDFRKRPLGQFELYTLNDKLENSSDEDEFQKQKKQIEQLELPFESLSSTLRTTKPVFIEKKNYKQAIVQKVKSKIQSFLKTKDNNKSAIQNQNDNWVFHADGYGKLMWDAFCMLLIFYEILSIPFKLSFDVEINATLDQIIDIMFMSDIVITFNTSIYRKGIPIYGRKQIVLNYIKLWFWIDLAASFPYDAIITASTGVSEQESSQTTTTSSQDATKYTQTLSLLRLVRFMRFIKIIRLLRLAKLKVFFDKIEDAIQLNIMLSTIVSFIKLSGFVLFWSHWLGCIFHYIAVNEDSQDNWLHYYGIYDEDWSVKYINSLYWAVTTMNTVGYGDISPRTPLERLFGIFFLMIATVVFSVTLNSIGSSLQGMEDKKAEIRKKSNQILKYMKKLQIPVALQNKVKKYLTYIWEQEAIFNLEHITDNLSYALKFEFEIQVNGTILGYCPPLRRNFQKTFLKQVTKTFKQYTALPEEFIFFENESIATEKHLYFIQSGNIEIILQRNNQKLNKLEQKDYFGEIGFFTGLSRTASARSVNYSSLVYIDKSLFTQLLKSNQVDLERFNYIKDEIIFNKGYHHINVFCYGCLRDDHTVIDCPDMHFVVEQQQYCQFKSNFQKKMQSLYERNDRVHIHALRHKNIVKFTVNQISTLAQKLMAQYDECNLIDEMDNGQIVEEKFEIQQKLAKPPRFGPFRSRFREDKAKYRKMKSYIQDQEIKIKSLKAQQNISQLLLKQLSIIMQQKTVNQEEQIIKTEFPQTKSMATSMKVISKFKEEDEDDSNDKQQSSEYQTVSSSDFDDEGSEEQADKLTQKEIKTQNQILELLETYNQQQKEREQREQQNKLESQFILINNFEVGADFHSYYPKYNKEQMIYEYNKIRDNQRFRPNLVQFYENDFYHELGITYIFDNGSEALIHKQFKSMLQQDRPSGKKLTRIVKQSMGLIKMPEQLSQFQSNNLIKFSDKEIQ
ncbi:unnamed protein product [Paramecium pentaurelia]|uniref:Cyclic nucleotide-binding domain-containing protein n=1 Tax=Paramecium pentaurelia TaxID=43138 RepID=A0A8S1VNT6_9CILI|nr:unnamed protein product [Paramecium pentaurelia]